MAEPRIHPTALIERNVLIGEGTAIWDNVHLRSGARIGQRCIIGEKTYVAGGVQIDDLVKINAFVYLCTGVTIARGVMVSAGVIFTNDRYPRATDPEILELRSSAPGPDTLSTSVEEGATLGARAVIGPGVTIGRWAMIGMGAVVTTDVPHHTLVIGQPARPVALVCRCGQSMLRLEATAPRQGSARCSACAAEYDYCLGGEGRPFAVDRTRAPREAAERNPL